MFRTCTSKTVLGVVLVLAAGVPALAADKPIPPELADILHKLDANRQMYFQSAPNLFCKEHVLSAVDSPDSVRNNRQTVTDSVFRLTRAPDAEHQLDFDEARTLERVDGKPATDDQKLEGPAIASGIFSNALAIVSTPMLKCYRYRMKERRTKGELTAIEIRFDQRATNESDPECPAQEESTGKVLIDPATMQVISVEKLVPHKVLTPDVVGPWRWTVTYGPVQLGELKLWMPHVIRSIAAAEAVSYGSSSPSLRRGGMTGGRIGQNLTWTFEATYSDFHRLHVESKIVPVKTPAQ